MINLADLSKLIEPTATAQFQDLIATEVDPVALSIAISTKRIADFLDYVMIENDGRPAIHVRDLR